MTPIACEWYETWSGFAIATWCQSTRYGNKGEPKVWGSSIKSDDPYLFYCRKRTRIIIIFFFTQEPPALAEGCLCPPHIGFAIQLVNRSDQVCFGLRCHLHQWRFITFLPLTLATLKWRPTCAPLIIISLFERTHSVNRWIVRYLVHHFSPSNLYNGGKTQWPGPVHLFVKDATYFPGHPQNVIYPVDWCHVNLSKCLKASTLGLEIWRQTAKHPLSSPAVAFVPDSWEG